MKQARDIIGLLHLPPLATAEEESLYCPAIGSTTFGNSLSSSAGLPRLSSWLPGCYGADFSNTGRMTVCSGKVDIR